MEPISTTLRGYIKVEGSGVSACKKLEDLMPINVTVTNSERIALPEIIKNVTIYTSSLKIKIQSLPFSLGLSRRIHAAHWSRIKLQIVWL